MSKKTCVRFIFGCLLTAVVGISANASADGLAQALLLDNSDGSSYQKCNYMPVFTETRALDGRGNTVCYARQLNTGIWAQQPCTEAAETVTVSLKTDEYGVEPICTDTKPFPGSAQCQGSDYMMQNSQGSCTYTTLTAVGGAFN